MNNPIYKPKGRALEYSPDALALNISLSCPHGCYYCFAPTALHKDRIAFHSYEGPRPGIVEAVKKQLDKGIVVYDEYVEDPRGNMKPEKRTIELKNKLIHLCFICDPYPTGHDTTCTREIIEAIKQSGNHVQILTKGGSAAERDFDLLDENDWFGVSISGNNRTTCTAEPNAADNGDRFYALKQAHEKGIKTWVSCEPVLVPDAIYKLICSGDYIDLYRIGKLNYHPSEINWAEFGRECERLCKEHGRNYYIKDGLRKEMEAMP